MLKALLYADLERQLAELNRQRVSDKSTWLLVQPSGVFPLVGPLFNPGETACWTCLFDRMIRNREVKGFLDRTDAHVVSPSPLARSPLGQGAIPFAALEVAKAIASGFRTDLNNHIVSHDLLGSTTVKHYVAQIHRMGLQNPAEPTPSTAENQSTSAAPVQTASRTPKLEVPGADGTASDAPSSSPSSLDQGLDAEVAKAVEEIKSKIGAGTDKPSD